MITKTADTSTVTFTQVVATLVGAPTVLWAIYSLYSSLGGAVQFIGF